MDFKWVDFKGYFIWFELVEWLGFKMVEIYLFYLIFLYLKYCVNL